MDCEHIVANAKAARADAARARASTDEMRRSAKEMIAEVGRQRHRVHDAHQRGRFVKPS
jgi:hypothetical protein